MKEIKTVLDLPMKRQQELAAMMKLSHEDWVREIKRNLQAGDEFLKGVYEAEANGGQLSIEERVRFQKKIDSGNPR